MMAYSDRFAIEEPSSPSTLGKVYRVVSPKFCPNTLSLAPMSNVSLSFPMVSVRYSPVSDGAKVKNVSNSEIIAM